MFNFYMEIFHDLLDGVHWENSSPEASTLKTLLTNVPGMDLFRSTIFSVSSHRYSWDSLEVSW